jgi:hypothetical protein
MTPSPEQALSELTHRLQEVEAELIRTRAERVPPARRHREARSAWVGALLIVVGTWVLAAQAPATLPPDIEQRLRALESLVRRGPGNATQMTAPFEVLSADGKPIVRVAGIPDPRVPVSIGAIPQGGGVISIAAGGVAQAVMSATLGRGEFAALDAKQVTRAALLGTGSMVVFDPTGEQLAGVTQGDAAGGRIAIWRAKEKVIDITTDAASGGSGIVSINTPSGKSVARLTTVDNAGELVLSNEGGTKVAFLGAKNGAGALSVMNSSGKAVAGLLGSGTGGGTVAVATSNGANVAEMTVSDDGRGVVQVRLRGGGAPVAVLSQAPDRVGGLVQISNASTPVANFTVGAGGAGYFQLADPSGNPTVEAGTLPNGRGSVRAGPNYLCSPAQPATPVMSFGIPDCLVGNKK